MQSGFLTDFARPLHSKIEPYLLNSTTLFVKQLNRQLEEVYGKEIGIYYLFLLDR
jgi:hypothetical protein